MSFIRLFFYLFSSILKIMWDSSIWTFVIWAWLTQPFLYTGLPLVKYVRNVLWQWPGELRHVCEAAPVNCLAWMGSCSGPWDKVQGRFLFFHFKADPGCVVCSKMGCFCSGHTKCNIADSSDIRTYSFVPFKNLFTQIIPFPLRLLDCNLCHGI